MQFWFGAGFSFHVRSVSGFRNFFSEMGEEREVENE